MDDSKALHLEAFAASKGLEFLRFDYRGHGRSEGEFLDCCLSDWMDDAEVMLETVAMGPTVRPHFPLKNERYISSYRET